MALAETLTDGDGDTHRMAGVLPADVRMCDRYQALDHVELRARTDALTADAGATIRGHEFHYSEADVASDAAFAFDVERGDGIADGKDGLLRAPDARHVRPRPRRLRGVRSVPRSVVSRPRRPDGRRRRRLGRRI